MSHSINLKPRPQRGFLCIPNFCCNNALRSLHRLLRRLGTGTGSPKGCANVWEYSEDGIVPNASDGSTGCNKVDAAG